MNWTDLGYNSFMENNPYLDNARYSSLEVQNNIPMGSVSMEKLFGEIITAMLADGAVTNAKISSISADKITTGQLSASAYIYTGSVASGNYIEQDGGNVRIVMYKSGTPSLVIGSV